MKNNIISLLLLAGLLYIHTTSLQAQNKPGKAKLYVIGLAGIRYKPGLGFLTDVTQDIKGFHLYIDTLDKGRLFARGYNEFEVPAGTHALCVIAGRNRKHAHYIKISMKPGAIYYISFNLDRGIENAEVQCNALSDSFGGKVIAELKTKEQHNKLPGDVAKNEEYFY